MTINSYQTLRERISLFVQERNWAKFHTPRNVMLALSGESGELAEIFQWKGPLNGLKGFDDKEKVHVGEEIADVFIYSTRLADLCGFDLASAVKIVLLGSVPNNKLTNDTDCWDPLLFTNVDEYIKQALHHPLKNLLKSNSPRDIALGIQSEVGKACNIFLSIPEEEYNPSGREVATFPKVLMMTDLSLHIATVCILLTCMTRVSNLSIRQCVTDKIKKNAAKYPVALVQGSAAKYTAYQNKLYGWKSLVTKPALLFLGFVTGLTFGITFGVSWAISQMVIRL